MGPQWYIDVRDATRLHIAAAALAGVDGERVFGFAEPYTWPDIVKVIEKGMERCAFMPQDKGKDLSTADRLRARALDLLIRLGREGWGGFDQAVREKYQSILSCLRICTLLSS